MHDVVRGGGCCVFCVDVAAMLDFPRCVQVGWKMKITLQINYVAYTTITTDDDDNSHDES